MLTCHPVSYVCVSVCVLCVYVCMCVCVCISCTHSLIVLTDCTASSFLVSDDSKAVTILKSGVYQIHVRAAGICTLNGATLGLQLNGTDIAQCLKSDANGYQNAAHVR